MIKRWRDQPVLQGYVMLHSCNVGDKISWLLGVFSKLHTRSIVQLKALIYFFLKKKQKKKSRPNSIFNTAHSGFKATGLNSHMTWTQHESGEWLKKTGRYLVPCSCVEHYYCLCQCCDWECKKCSTLRNVTSIRVKKSTENDLNIAISQLGVHRMI